jgi:hypothetical protein
MDVTEALWRGSPWAPILMLRAAQGKLRVACTAGERYSAHLNLVSPWYTLGNSPFYIWIPGVRALCHARARMHANAAFDARTQDIFACPDVSIPDMELLAGVLDGGSFPDRTRARLLWEWALGRMDQEPIDPGIAGLVLVGAARHAGQSLPCDTSHARSVRGNYQLKALEGFDWYTELVIPAVNRARDALSTTNVPTQTRRQCIRVLRKAARECRLRREHQDVADRWVAQALAHARQSSRDQVSRLQIAELWYRLTGRC